MIDNVRKTVMAILSKDNRGYVTPEEFNLFAAQAQMEIFEEDFYTLGNEITKQNNRLGGDSYSDRVNALIDNIDKFRDSFSSVYGASYFSLPTNLHMIDMNGVVYNGTTEVERVHNHQILALNRSLDTAPSTLYPVYVKTDSGLKVYPDTITSGITINYIRVPSTPKWTWEILSAGEPMFNQGANDYQDFELPLSYETKLVYKILQLAGYSIGENEIAQAANSIETQDKQEKL